MYWQQYSQISNCTVCSKLYQCNSLYPILSFICKSFDHLLNSTVLPLSLAVSLRVVSTAKQRLHAQHTQQCLTKVSSETYIAIIYDILWCVKEPNPIVEKNYATCGVVSWPSSALQGTSQLSLPNLSTTTVNALNPSTSDKSIMKP